MSGMFVRGRGEYPKPKILVADEDKLKLIKEKEAMGLIFPHEKHMIVNPRLTEEEAMEREEGIMKVRAERIAQFTGGISANNKEPVSENPGSEKS